MGFLSPWFLAGLAAVGIPLYVHLLRQHRSIPQPFSSLMFFEKRTQSSIKHRRLMHLLLLAIRLALLILLVLAFANPYIKRAAAPLGEGNKHLVLAVDNSFSMRTGDRLTQAKQQAASVLSGFRPGDRGQVIAFGSQVQILTQPIESAAELQAALQSITPSDGRSSYGELSRTLRTLAQGTKLPIEVHLFSDMQKSSMPPAFSELAMAGNTRLTLHPVGGEKDPNYYVESVSAPPSIYQPKKVRVQATVAGAGAPAREVAVSLALNGRVAETKNVAIPEGGRSTVEFFLQEAAYGLNRGEVRISWGDRLAEDDVFRFAMERKEASRVLFVYEARRPRGLLYYRAALDAAGDSAFAIDPVTADRSGGVDPKKYAFVVLSDVGVLPSSFDQSLREYVRRGGSVLIALGSVSATRPKVPVLDEAIVESNYSARSRERFQMAGSLDSTHPSVQKTNGFEGVKFYQTVKVEPGDARVVARLSDQTPLLLEKKLGEGRVLAFASTFDNIANDLPLHASFVPFVEQTAQYLSGVDSSPAHYAVNSHVDLRSARDRRSGVEVIGPEGNRELSLAEAANLESYQLPQEGFYELRRANGRHELVAAHADRRESDLAKIPQETLALWENTGQGDGGPAGSAQDPVERPLSLWWYVALMLLAVTIAESVLGSRYLRAEREPLVYKKAA